MNQHHPFHMVFISPWPILARTSTLYILVGTAYWIRRKRTTLITISIIITIGISAQWWRDVSRERSLQGCHTKWVINGIRWGIILFIVSEILFFFRFFWAFFHRRLAPNIEVGTRWPPLGILSLRPFQVPLLNTAVLLASGVTVTWAHHNLINIENKTTNTAISITISLGLYFTLLQAWEYWDASYTIRDSSFGSVFFIATGFHGLHVLIGSLFLAFSYARHKINLFSYYHHVGIEIAIWYWHFVDVVWLFLFRFVYWWSYYSISTKKYNWLPIRR